MFELTLLTSELCAAEFKDIPEGSVKWGIAVTVNHQGSRLLISQGRTVTVSQLSFDGGQLAVQPVRTFHFGDYHGDVFLAYVLWSQNDAYAVVEHGVYDKPAAQNAHAEAYRVTYLYSTATGTLQRVLLKHPEGSSPGPAGAWPVFSGCGQYLIISFSVNYEGCFFDIFLTASNEFHARIYTAAQISDFVSLQPNGPLFAAGASAGVVLFDCKTKNVQSFLDLFPEADEFELIQSAFTSDGAELMMIQGRKPSPFVHLLDISTGACKHIPLMMPPDAWQIFHELTCSCTSFVLNRYKHVVLFSSKDSGRSHQLIAILPAVSGAVSADGVFCASIHCEEHHGILQYKLCVHEMVHGQLLHAFEPEGWALVDTESVITFDLHWASNGSCFSLFVIKNMHMCCGISRDDPSKPIELFVFSF